MFSAAIQKSVQDGTVYGTAETFCSIGDDETKEKRKCVMLSYDGINNEDKDEKETENPSDWELLEEENQNRPKIQIRSVLACTEDDKLQFVSAYPVIPNGYNCHLKLVEINEWENGIEAVLECETEDGISISL